MSRDREENELLVGRPVYIHRGVVISFLGILFLFLGASTLVIQGITDSELLLIPTILLVINLYFLYDFHGTRYHITSSRVLSEHLHFPRRKQEIPLERIKSIQAKRRRGRGFIVFKSAGSWLAADWRGEVP